MGKPKKEKYDFSGWATRFNIKCSDGRTIRPKAFKGNDGCVVPLVWNHDHNDVDNVLGHALLEEREEGVYAYCSFNDTDKGQKAKKLITHGDICALSIYANQLKQNGGDVIHGCIREVSLVLAGANPGAYINNVILHSENGETILNDKGEAVINEEEAEIFHGYSGITIFNDEPNAQNDKEIGNTMPTEKENNVNEQDADKGNKNENLSHAEKNDEEETVQDVFDTLTEKQKTVVYALIGQAIEEANKESKEEDNNVKHNAFDEQNDQNEKAELMHSEIIAAIKDVTENKKYGSMKESFLAHSITNIGELFPEVKAVNAAPKVVDIENDWVKVVMGGVKHSPFARVKSTYANLTADDARARGYVKGRQKVEEVLVAFKRVTTPQTVYKLQKIDRDDVVDITDFDVIAWIKTEMREKLDQEIARAILVGDGRDPLSNDRINPDNVRPISTDTNVYTIKRTVGYSDSTAAQAASILVDDSVLSMEDYKGSGNITMFVRRDVLSRMLLLKDLNGRRIYKDVRELATAMLVNRIVPVPTGIMGDVYAINIDLADYNVGADKGGAVNMFDDFDIDYNKYEYLIETRISGANVTPYSAVAFIKGTEPTPTPEVAGE